MIFELLNLCIEKGASDLHFKVAYPPILRIDGTMRPIKDMPVITFQDYEIMLEAILDDVQLVNFNRNRKLDLGYSFQNARFRVNLFYDFHGGNAVFRVIPFKNLSFSDIDLPVSGRKLADKQKGIVLVTGATGAGKSTTLSAFITHINSNYQKTIVTVEDPIEYLFEDEKSLINQRQVGVDCANFEEGIRGALKMDCDVLMVGELRNPEAVEMTLLAAESGKLVFATLHSNTSIQAIERFVNLFPQNLHSQIIGRLASHLQGVVTQVLVPRKQARGRMAAFEILLNTPAVRGLITENRINLISSYLESGSSSGMISLDQSLIELICDGKVDKTEAFMRANNRDFVRRKVEEREASGGVA
ncbi:MAG: twitching motility protein PilT [Clostridiales bacterium]|jgi:twitching motility protein PilT|nr:twitching motility protein PilT [Clostridiales bacterium]MDN5281593.1 twitching motility protein PilT [Candidatus Ozemobacter sp.]